MLTTIGQLAGGKLTVGGHCRTKGAMILHLGDKNLPPACTSSIYLISERYYENHYNNGKAFSWKSASLKS
jgi:hypothetical protein